MSKDLTIGTEVFPYPIEGEGNYGEAATGWAEAATDVLADVFGPGDIATTEVTLSGTSSGGSTSGTITNLLFDTSFVQSIVVTGFIKRNYTDTTFIVEAFTIEGVYNGTEIDFYPVFSGSDTELDFTVSGGQFGFSYLDDDGSGKTTDNVVIKFSAKAISDV